MPYTDFSFEPNNTDKFVDGSTKLNKTNLDKLVNNIVANHNDIGAANTNITSLATNKVDKVTGTANDIVTFGSNGAIADSGKTITTSVANNDTTVPTGKAVTTALNAKSNKVSSTTKDHFVSFSDTKGTLKDSGKSASDFSKVEAVTGTASGTALTGLTVDGTSYTIPQGGGSAGVSSIGGATGAISLGTGMSMSGQTLNGPDLSGFVEKQTTTASTPRAYTYSRNGGDGYLPVIKSENTPNSIVQRTIGGQIVTGDPTDDIHAANKKYVDDNFAPKATNGYAELDSNGAVQGLKDIFVDFGGGSICVQAGDTGLKLRNALLKYGFAIINNGTTYTGSKINPQTVVRTQEDGTGSVCFHVSYVVYNTSHTSYDVYYDGDAEYYYHIESDGTIAYSQI